MPIDADLTPVIGCLEPVLQSSRRGWNGPAALVAGERDDETDVI